ncbi:MAG: hypothetical protein QG673_154 [Pseudomonadota bacterium]|nr:hypothetical protein [Pseudomonadota bacterium]
MDQILNFTHESKLLLYTFIIMLLAIIALLTNKIKQPAVLGQILVGCIISILANHNIIFFKDMTHEPVLGFLAELGSILLLFEIGLESKLQEITNCGRHALIVAITGVTVPFILGYFILTPLIAPHYTLSLSLFIASILAVTSTGISVSVFKDMGILRQRAAQIVLSASIIDDIIGLVLLSIITELEQSGNINLLHILTTLILVFLFFVISWIVGKLILPQITTRITSKISKDDNIITFTVIAFCLFLAWMAQLVGLAPIIGAFTAGLLIQESYFKDYKFTRITRDTTISAIHNQHIIKLISQIGTIFIPIFFIYAGMQVNIANGLNYTTLKLTILLSIFAIFSKSLCGIFLPKTINKWIVGFGMVPRGEIGIIFALAGLKFKLIDNNLFTALLLMVIITSIITPIILNRLVKPINLDSQNNVANENNLE